MPGVVGNCPTSGASRLPDQPQVPSGPTNNASPSFGFSPESGSSVVCSIDQGTPSFGACSGPTSHGPASPLPDGAYTFRVRATDAAGNTATATRSFTVDTTPPSTTIDSGPTGLTNDPTPTFGFSASEGGSSFQCRVDSDPFASCTSPSTTSALSDGPHTFEVRATDQAANTDQTPASRSFTVDTQAPNTTITGKPQSKLKTTKGSAKVKVSFTSEPGATFECKLDKAEYQPCRSPYSVRAKSKGGGGKKHTISIQATDQAGNGGSPATVKFKVIRKG